MTLSSIDVLLTNYCNQSCPFCFAKKEMASPYKKEISFSDFKLLVRKMSEAGILGVNFLGGEPSLHSEFARILKYALRNFLFVRIYTNGIFPEESKKIMLEEAKRLYLVFNVSTPAFRFNKKIREQVLENISEFASKTAVVLAVTDVWQNDNILQNVFEHIDNSLLKKVSIRLGITTPMVDDKNSIAFEDFSKIGVNICSLIEFLETNGPPKSFRFNTGMTPCMFSKDKRSFLRKKKIRIRPNCHLGFEGDWFYVSTDLSTFRCYPLSSLDREKITADTDLKDLRDKYIQLQDFYTSRYVSSRCSSCPVDKRYDCSGPCIAFRMNSEIKNN